MSNTDRLDGFAQCNLGLTRFTSSGNPELIGTGPPRRSRLHNAENPEEQAYERRQGDQPIYGFAMFLFYLRFFGNLFRFR
jgi:hypothetical protein